MTKMVDAFVFQLCKQHILVQSPNGIHGLEIKMETMDPALTMNLV
jgi:hypothetical protein